MTYKLCSVYKNFTYVSVLSVRTDICTYVRAEVREIYKEKERDKLRYETVIVGIV